MSKYKDLGYQNESFDENLSSFFKIRNKECYEKHEYKFVSTICFILLLIFSFALSLLYVVSLCIEPKYCDVGFINKINGSEQIEITCLNNEIIDYCQDIKYCPFEFGQRYDVNNCYGYNFKFLSINNFHLTKNPYYSNNCSGKFTIIFHIIFILMTIMLISIISLCLNKKLNIAIILDLVLLGLLFLIFITFEIIINLIFFPKEVKHGTGNIISVNNSFVTYQFNNMIYTNKLKIPQILNNTLAVSYYNKLSYNFFWYQDEVVICDLCVNNIVDSKILFVLSIILLFCLMLTFMILSCCSKKINFDRLIYCDCLRNCKCDIKCNCDCDCYNNCCLRKLCWKKSNCINCDYTHSQYNNNKCNEVICNSTKCLYCNHKLHYNNCNIIIPSENCPNCNHHHHYGTRCYNVTKCSTCGHDHNNKSCLEHIGWRTSETEFETTQTPIYKTVKVKKLVQETIKVPIFREKIIQFENGFHTITPIEYDIHNTRYGFDSSYVPIKQNECVGFNNVQKMVEKEVDEQQLDHYEEKKIPKQVPTYCTCTKIYEGYCACKNNPPPNTCNCVHNKIRN